MTTLLFIGVDPGKESGLASICWNASEDRWNRYETHALDAQALCDTVWSTLNGVPWSTHISVERFTMSGRTSHMTRQNDAIEVIGALRWMSTRWRNKVTFRVRGAAEATKTGNHDVQRAAGLWRVGVTNHERRAVAQLLTGISQRTPDLFVELTRGGKINADT